MNPTATESWAASAIAKFGELLEQLATTEADTMTHADLEDRLAEQGREVVRQLFQDRLELRAAREQPLPAVVDDQGVPRTHVVHDQSRTLTTIFGDVRVQRLAYRRRGFGNLSTADAVLNLPAEQYSHGLRRVAASEASKVSFAEAVDGVRAATHAPAVELPQRQLEELVARAAVDFDAFYAQNEQPAQPVDAPLALSFDGKGVVMRPEALRPGTAAAAATANPASGRARLGNKAHRRRMAEIAAVFDVQPSPRTKEDILGPPDHQQAPAPVTSNKWVTVSVVDDVATVVAQGFEEAQRRDPRHRRTWLALVDGNNDQLNAIADQARRRKVQVTVVIDFIHVLEHIWKAAHCFFSEQDPRAEAWVREKGLEVLDGHASLVAAAIRRKATVRLAPHNRKAADECADYLLRKKAYLDYPTALVSGWPIATGVIEGACRHLVQDRMDITGARWGLDSAEAVLKIRALRTNGDFDRYWAFHLAQEQDRLHRQRYAGHVIPSHN